MTRFTDLGILYVVGGKKIFHCFCICALSQGVLLAIE
jgi:hypothetical protein